MKYTDRELKLIFLIIIGILGYMAIMSHESSRNAIFKEKEIKSEQVKKVIKRR